MLSVSLDDRQGPVMRLLEVTWGWIHYRVVYRDTAKLKWWYKVATMLEHRYSRELFCAGVECQAT